MRTLTYAGKDLSEFNVVWDGSMIYNKPKKRSKSYSIPFRNGDLIWSEENFDNIEISFPCFIRNDFDEHYSELINYLNSFDTYQRLEMSTKPDIYRMGFLHSAIDPTTTAFNIGGKFVITFDCMPQEWLKSGENEVPVKMYASTRTGTSIEAYATNASVEVESLNVDFSPTQDLHGYPPMIYGGRNLLDFRGQTMSQTVYGVTFTLLENGWMTATGTSETENVWFPLSVMGAIPNGTYIFNGLPSGAGSDTFGFAFMDANDNILQIGENEDSRTTFIKNFGLYVRSGATVDAMFKPMVRRASDYNEEWLPYSNICPITGGQTQASVTHGNETYSNDLGRTVYSGSLDMVSGILTVDKVMITKTWGEFENKVSSGDFVRGSVDLPYKAPLDPRGGQICNVASFKNADTEDSLHFFCADDYAFIFLPRDISDDVEIQILYELATPLKYNLTAHDITMVAGNNVFTSTLPMTITLKEGTYLFNPSYMKAKPLFKMYGIGEVIINETASISLFLSPSNTPVYVDCETMECYSYDSSGNIVNENRKVTLPEGFITLDKGLNTVTVTGADAVCVPRWWRL